MTQSENNRANLPPELESESPPASYYEQFYQTISDTASAVSSYASSRIPSPEIPKVALPEIPSLSNISEMCFGSGENNESGNALERVQGRMEKVKVAANPKQSFEMGHVEAGRKGEEMVLRELQKLGKVRQAVRIPGTEGRFEIDLVLEQRNKITLFEVKNWTGTLELTPTGEWKQIRNKNSTPPELIHANVLEKTRHKMCLFREKLSIPKDKISCFVIFPKENLKITYAIGIQPEVLSAKEFMNWVHRQTPSPMRVFSELVLPKSWTGFDEKTTARIKESIGECGTWDEIHLEGGRVLTGDFKAGPGKLSKLKRSETASASFNHTRNQLIGGIKAIFGKEPKVEISFFPRNSEGFFDSIVPQPHDTFECAIDSVVFFRKAGDRIDSRIRNIENLEKSCKKSAKIATESISKVESLKRENSQLDKTVDNLTNENVDLSSRLEKAVEEKNDLQKKLETEQIRAGRLAESISFVKSESEKDMRSCQKEINQLRSDSTAIKEENKSLKQNLALQNNVGRNLEVAKHQIEALKKEVAKYKMMAESYKAELEHTITKLQQDKKVDAQNQLGQILLERIEIMLKSKELKSPEKEAECKKLKKRQKILKKYLQTPTPSAGQSSSPRNEQSFSDEDDLSDDSSTMSQVAAALQKLEQNLL
ncbi:Oidioi.mRNA.OKI2018_I69.chr2.g4476.t1.cds [Oikopleura dioica]|uniref:Oidioi.mRNA.OKI2018_I69.chr2.g4476.t1.cds n=1 Tax=Oikopleura dioica TaxID=34765 RepID=A0ABN7SXI5_OIKDI|nr:Oidioi.mRNA.OKI2018_I69.chr2.g4476.t1.cds [Oikopleura dioica]